VNAALGGIIYVERGVLEAQRRFQRARIKGREKDG